MAVLTPDDTVRENLLNVTGYEVLGKLPDPFVMDDGRRISDPSEWEARRAEIYRTAVELQYGHQFPEPEFVDVELICYSHVITYLIHTGTRENPLTFRMQLIKPDTKEEKFPVIVDGDMCWRYHMDKEFLNAALDKGIGWAIFDRTELAHDVNNEGRGKGAIYKTYPDCDSGALGAWAWGYSRVVDALEKLRLPIDLDWIAFTGHSRGGKTAALAGALDRRARIVNPNETCAGACGCYRIHMKGFCEGYPEQRSETLNDIYHMFPFWFGTGMEKYMTCEDQLPFDTHYLKAMVAPRTLFVSEASADIWSNPIGSYQTTVAAGEVFKFLGVPDNLFWYFRPGSHAHALSDVRMLVNLIRHQRNGEELSDHMFKLPFAAPEKIYDWKAPGTV
jgi:hypothetical protein